MPEDNTQQTSGESPQTSGDGGDSASVSSSMQKVGASMQQVKDAAAQSFRGAAGSAAGAAHESLDSLRSKADAKTSSTAQALTGIADRLKGADSDIDDEWVAQLAGSAEATLRKAATYLTQAKPNAIMSDVVKYARSNPAVAMGGAIALGFLMARAGRTAAHDLHS